MTSPTVDDLNVNSQEILISPAELKAELPASERAIEVVAAGRQVVRDILDRKDHRLIVVIGPCSIHDPIAAMDYARRLKPSPRRSATVYT